MSQKPVSYERFEYRVIMDSPIGALRPNSSTLVALLEATWPRTTVVYVTTVIVPPEPANEVFHV